MIHSKRNENMIIFVVPRLFLVLVSATRTLRSTAIKKITIVIKVLK